jgi:hypothetical protein
MTALLFVASALGLGFAAAVLIIWLTPSEDDVTLDTHMIRKPREK